MTDSGGAASASAQSVTIAAAPAGPASDAAHEGGQPTDVKDRAPVIIYIAGSGRSGSTLLERTLGEMPGFVNVGELIDLPRRTVSKGERCGCGSAFAECPFWSRVGEMAFGGWESAPLAELHQLQFRVARQRRMLRLAALPLAGEAFRADLAEYGAHYSRLYQAIAASSGASYVVDASKWPAQALALAKAGLDVRVIHLIRDVRGVAYSLSKRQTRPQAAGGEAGMMVRKPPVGGAARWVACQAEAELLRGPGVPVARERYEDFVRQPRQTVERALAKLGVPLPQPSHLAHIGDGSVTLGPSHGISGNPGRFREGDITLAADTAWREKMGRRDKIMVTAIGLPLMMRYRSVGTRAQGKEARRD